MNDKEEFENEEEENLGDLLDSLEGSKEEKYEQFVGGFKEMLEKKYKKMHDEKIINMVKYQMYVECNICGKKVISRAIPNISNEYVLDDEIIDVRVELVEEVLENGWDWIHEGYRLSCPCCIKVSQKRKIV